MATLAAVDLGAQSGRVAAGPLRRRALARRARCTASRTCPCRRRGTLQLGRAPALRRRARRPARRRAARRGTMDAVGVDSWGGRLRAASTRAAGCCGNPRALSRRPPRRRDARPCSGAIPPRELYERTGIQLMPINTRLRAGRDGGRARSRRSRRRTALLLIPDLLHSGCAGVATTERTNATTTQCFDPRAGRLGRRACSSASTCPARSCPRSCRPARVLGGARRRGRRADTAPRRRRRGRLGDPRHRLGRRRGAVPASAARPTSARAPGRSWASSSTQPAHRRRGFAANLTNEGGVAGTVRLLRNVTGLWLVHECRRAWALEGDERSLRGARRSSPTRAAARLAHRAERPALRAAGRHAGAHPRLLRARRGQPAPETPGEVVRCVLESLALKHRQTIELLASVTGAVPRPRSTSSAGALATRCSASGRRTPRACPVLAGPGGGHGARQPARAGDRARRARLARRGARGRARVVRAVSLRAARRRALGGGPRALRGASRRRECRRWQRGERDGRPCSAASPPPQDRWDGRPRQRSSTCSTSLVYRSNLLGADRALANQGGGNTSAKGIGVDHAGRETRTLWVKGSGTDLATIAPGRLRRPPPRRGAAAAQSATRWTTRRWSPTCAAARSTPDAAAAARSRRCCTRSSRPRTSITPIPTPIIALTSSPRRARAGGGGVRRRGRLARLPAARLRRCRSASPSCCEQHPQARAVLLEKHGLVTWGDTSARGLPQHIEFVTRAAAGARAGGRRAASGSAARKSGQLERRRRGCSPAAGAARRCAARCSPTPTASCCEVDRSPEAVAFASSARAPEVSQVGAPCPDHLINTKHKPLVGRVRPRDATAPTSCARRCAAGVAEYARLVSRLLRSATSTDESRPFPIDPAGPRVVVVPGRRHRHARRATPARPGSRATSTTARSPSRTPPRPRRVPLAERGRGVRHRVLAARALQACAGAAARRARRAVARGHRRRERHRPRDGAAAWPSSARTSSWPTSTRDGRRTRWPTRSSPPHGHAPRARRSPST